MNEKTIKYWMETAKYDLETAKAMLKTKRYLYVGFMCHQCIEKSLRGYYVSIKNEIPPYIHNLLFLSERSDLYNYFSEKQKDLLNELQSLSMEVSYPKNRDELSKNLSKERCKQIIKRTEELSKWMTKRLKIN
ncbi:MAG: HEPN domain-containing protein [Candidatus Omnitrophica bacterium]|nr:HEPN domain-containing protein [Candidatus Omnitrophota bacterium]